MIAVPEAKMAIAYVGSLQHVFDGCSSYLLSYCRHAQLFGPICLVLEIAELCCKEVFIYAKLLYHSHHTGSSDTMKDGAELVDVMMQHSYVVLEITAQPN